MAVTDNSIICTSRATAFATLETITNSMPRGTQRDALIAINYVLKDSFIFFMPHC
jgi:hypothetical protein